MPDGTKFAKPILVGVPMTLDAPAGWPTAAYTLEGGKWARAALLDGSPTLSFYVPASGRAFFATDHFSKWTPGKQFDIFFHPWGAPDYLFVPACDFQESWAGLSGLRKWVEDDVKRRILYREVLLDVATHSRRARTEIEQAKSAGLQKAAAGLKSAATTNKIGALITKLGQIAAQAHPEAFSPAATQALDHGAALMGTLGSAVGVTNAALKCVNEHLATGAIAQRIDMGQANAVEIQADWTKTGFYNYVLQFLADIGKDNAALTQALQDQAELRGARVDAIAGALPGACDKLPGDADASVRLLCQGDGACGVAFGSEACDVCMVQACCEQSAACALDAACKKKCLVGEAPVLPECGDLAKCQTASCAQACGVCVGGTTKCGNKCVDTQTDAANCGACGVACAPGEICSAGKCEIKYAGKHLWSKGFGGADYDHGHSVAVDGSGNAFVTGLFGDEVPQLGTLPPGSHLWPVPAATTRDLATRVALVAGTGGHK
ncbi:MAG: SBBP repeat-containing protein [Deltaproteobacteria bacterium]|nr:SBBP repeat-containing protein [Deltaproteobacteria bacterium]